MGEVLLGLVQRRLPDRVSPFTQVDAVGGQIRSQIAIPRRKLAMHVEIVGPVALGNDRKPLVQAGDPIVLDIGGAGGQDGLEDDLGLGVTLAEVDDELGEVLNDVPIADAPFDIIHPRHDVDGAGLGAGQVARSRQNSPCSFAGDALVEPGGGHREAIAGVPQAEGIAEHDGNGRGLVLGKWLGKWLGELTGELTGDRSRFGPEKGSPLLVGRLPHRVLPSRFKAIRGKASIDLPRLQGGEALVVELAARSGLGDRLDHRSVRGLAERLRTAGTGGDAIGWGSSEGLGTGGDRGIRGRWGGFRFRKARKQGEVGHG